MSLPGNIGLLARMPTPDSSQYGNVDGPASSTDNAVVRWNGTTGRLIQNSTVIMSDNGDILVPSTATSGLQLYNSADQVTNYERLEALWSSNVIYLGQSSGGSGASRAMRVGIAPSATALSNANSRRVDFSPTAPFITLNQGQSSAATGAMMSIITSNTTTAGTVAALSLTPTYNQASGTASNIDFLVDRTQTAVGSGSQYLAMFRVGGADRAWVDSGGTGFFSGFLGIRTTAAGAAVFRIGSANNSFSAWGVNGVSLRNDGGTFTDSSTAGSGTAASAVFSSFAQPTLAATNASVTTTDAATVYIANAPTAGTNQTITRPHALWIDAGSFRLDGTTGAGVATGTLTNAPSAGDPDKWIPINSDGTQYWIPAWSA